MRLRRLELKDANGMLEWMKDPEIMKYFRLDTKDASLENTRLFIAEAQKSFDAKTSLNYAVTDELDEYMGTISLKNIDVQAMNAEYAICLRRVAQGKGLGKRATQEILRIAFEELGLNRVYLNVLSHNHGAIHLYQKIGFTYEGEFRQHLMLKGTIRSLQWYSMLKGEYQNNRT